MNTIDEIGKFLNVAPYSVPRELLQQMVVAWDDGDVMKVHHLGYNLIDKGDSHEINH